MRIENHRLVSDPGVEDTRVEFIPDETAGMLVPELVVIHYAVTETARATASVLNAREYCSCHLTIDKTGLVIQQVPFNRVAWHAGESLYRGRPSVSKFALGIEISSPGPLERRGGQYFTTYGKPWTGEVVEGYHPNDAARKSWKYWAGYSQTELDLCAHICELFRRTYGIGGIVGHDEISPGRKSDPGPAFPMNWLRQVVFPTRDTEPAPPLSPEDEETKPDVRIG